MLIGITGGIGSGKSTVAAELLRRGYPVYDTDKAAKTIIVHNPAVRSQVELIFGSEVFDGDRYRTDYVAKQVFADRSLLQRLNQVVHPAVIFDLQHWYRQQKAELCFFETALLTESGLDKVCDAVVEVTAPVEVRIERTMARDHATREQVLARIHAQQSTIDYPLSTLHFPLSNDGLTPVSDLVDDLLKSLFSIKI